MAKKHFGRFIVLAAISGAAAASISYFLRYRSFHKELDEEFHDFEDDFDDALEYEGTDSEKPQERNYVPLGTESRPELKTGEGEAKIYRSGRDAGMATKDSEASENSVSVKDKSASPKETAGTDEAAAESAERTAVKSNDDGATTITEDTAI